MQSATNNSLIDDKNSSEFGGYFHLERLDRSLCSGTSPIATATTGTSCQSALGSSELMMS